MKRPVRAAIIVFLLMILCDSSHCLPVISSIQDNRGAYPSFRVPKYDKFEVTFDCTLPGAVPYSNPFDPDEIAVQAHFIRPITGEEIVVPAFWYQGYTRSQVSGNEVLTPAGQPIWKVRFAPRISGTWQYWISATDNTGTRTSATDSFVVTSSYNRGFLRVSPSTPRYFEFDNGDSFFGIGLDICTDTTPTQETYRYDYYLSELDSHGANMFRFWFLNSEIESATPYGHWAWSLQDSQLGADYDLEDAWRVDYLLDEAAEKGIYLLVTTMDFSRFMEGEWENNLYSWRNGGPCTNPWDLWTDEIPKQYYRQVLRYLAARWGYSTSVLAWEHWNEWHELEWHTSLFNVAEGIAWHQEMGSYLKSVDPNHMVTTSMGSFDAYDSLWNLDEMDFPQMHGYYYNQSRYPWDWWVYEAGKDMGMFIPHFAENVLYYGKPALFGEFGITGAPGQQDELTLQDVDAVYLHNGIWAGLMHGLAGTPMAWRWHLFPSHPQWWDHFLGLSRFVEDIQFNRTDFTTLDSSRLQVANGGYENGTTDWVLWPEGGSFTIDSTVRYSGQSSLRYQTWDGSTAQINKYSWLAGFDLLPDRPYVLSAWIRTENIDDAFIFMWFSGLPRLESNRIDGTNGWTQLVVEFTTPSDIDDYYFGARISGPGTAWFDDFQMVLVDALEVSDDNLRAMALRNNDEAYVWIQNSQHTWYRVAALGLTPQVVSGATLTIPNMDAGVYKVDWWDTYSGTVVATTPVSVGESEELTVAIPPLQTDIACKILLDPDSDGDGLLNEYETLDLDPDTPGVQNPFDPEDPDSTGDDFETGPDGIRDGWNDWDGDGVNNVREFLFGYDPTDPDSWPALPALTTTGIAVLVLVVLLTAGKKARRAGASGRTP